MRQLPVELPPAVESSLTTHQLSEELDQERGSRHTEVGAWVQARRLDGFPWPGRFAYIKIDVKAAEQLVLAGAEHLLRGEAPMVWSVELLDTQQRLGSTKEALLQAFESWHYRFHSLPTARQRPSAVFRRCRGSLSST